MYTTIGLVTTITTHTVDDRTALVRGSYLGEIAATRRELVLRVSLYEKPLVLWHLWAEAVQAKLSAPPAAFFGSTARLQPFLEDP